MRFRGPQALKDRKENHISGHCHPSVSRSQDRLWFRAWRHRKPEAPDCSNMKTKPRGRFASPRGFRDNCQSLLYCLLGLLGSDVGSDFGSGLLARGCLDAPCSPACACETRSIRVPLSRCTFFPAEVITEPSVAFEPAALRFRPFRPKTPWLFEVSWPAVFKPPTAPFEVPAILPAAFAAEFTVPPATPPTLAAVFVTVPAAPPAVEVTPPSAPRPPVIPDPAAEAPTPPIASMSDPAADALLCAEAIAWIPALNGISWPFFRIALSNTMPSEDSDSPLPRAFASVTCPTSFDPLGITTSPSDLVFSVVLPVTVSPGLFFLQSTGLVRTAFIVVPCATLAEFLPACAEALPEVLFDAAAPDLLA